MKLPYYHEDPQKLHVGVEPPRSYYIPYADEQSALNGDRDKSAFFTSLCGQWAMIPIGSYGDIAGTDEFLRADISKADRVTVPGCIQLYDRCKYDKPAYSNLCYSFMTDPPYVPYDDPVWAYVRDFDLTADSLSLRQYLVFEGVAPCFYLYVNDNFAGYSQVSHCVSEFDVTKYLHAGKNRLTVLVLKFCDGTYLEDQDFFRLSGIFREVYLLSRPAKHIEDIHVRQSFSGDLSRAALRVELTGTAGKTEYELLAPGGGLVSHGEGHGGDLEIAVNDPILWNDEQPLCYKLLIKSRGEVIPLLIALRKVVIADGVLLINGKKVKLRGVNRHDSSPETGYAVSMDDMRRDIFLMKRANVNAVRTSHYPNDPRFPLLCCEYGLYLIDEADLETHGMGYNNDDSWDWTRWSFLSNSPHWRGAYVDRAARLYERDKNCGCVVMWSLGNESGCGVNHRAMREYIKGRDREAIVHYENAHLEFKAVPEGENFADISDVESRMYAGVGYIEKYLNDDRYYKPFFMCEYVDSMSTGDVYDYWRLVDKYDNFCGGCIWEFCDHAVDLPALDGSPRYYYGGDFGDFPNNGIGCIDGLVYPDRRPRPGYYDMKKVYEPFRGGFKRGILSLTNVRSFTPLSDLSLQWSVACSGREVLHGEIASLDVAPGKTARYRLFDPSALSLTGDAFLTVSVVSASDAPWAEGGYEYGFLQFELPTAKQDRQPVQEHPIAVDDDGRRAVIACGGNSYVFDLVRGCICSISRAGEELLASPAAISIYHAPTYNGGSSRAWHDNCFDHAYQKTYSAKVVSADETHVIIKVNAALGGPSSPPALLFTQTYTFIPDGSFTVRMKGTVREDLPVMPRLGFLFTLRGQNERIRYFGLGELETYPDRYLAARYGDHSLTVTDDFEHYIRPQENSSHFRTRRVFVGREGGAGIYVEGAGKTNDFSFSASHYSVGQIERTAHDFELVPEDKTYLNIDARFCAISENKELDNDKNNRLLDEKTFDFTFRISAENTERMTKL